MKFGAPEVARAKTMKAAGFQWRPRVGDWYVDHTGYCDLVRTYEQAQSIGRNGHAFLPSWDDCRAWLADRGWGCPEIIQDEPGRVSMMITHEKSEEIKRAVGASDLDCLYSVILMIILAG